MGKRGPKTRPSAEERMKDKIVIDPVTGCHNWTGYKNKDGYGLIKVDGNPVRAHRLAYEQHTGRKIPKGMCVLHDYCDNPPCCNPEHLRLGTHQDNMDDMVSKGRQARGEILASKRRGEKHGRSKLSDEQVIKIRSSPKTLRQLAEEYGVNFSLIGKIKRRERWSHVSMDQ